MRKLVLLFCLLCFIFQACVQDLLDTSDMASKITGVWRCEEKSSIYGTSTFQVTISKSSTDNTKVLIDNFYQLGSGKTISAWVESFSVNIAQQEIDGNIINGTGVISSNGKQIELSYTVNDKSNQTDNVTATLTPY